MILGTSILIHQHPLETIQVLTALLGMLYAISVWKEIRKDYLLRRIGNGDIEMTALARKRNAVGAVTIQLYMLVGGVLAIALEPPSPVNQQVIMSIRGIAVSITMLWLSYRQRVDRGRLLEYIRQFIEHEARTKRATDPASSTESRLRAEPKIP